MKYRIAPHAIARFNERFPDMGINIYQALSKATVYKGWRNDTRYSTYLYERYGYDLQDVLIVGGCAFIVRKNAVITAIGTTRIMRPTLPLEHHTAKPKKHVCKRTQRRGFKDRLTGQLRDRHERQIEERIHRQ